MFLATAMDVLGERGDNSKISNALRDEADNGGNGLKVEHLRYVHLILTPMLTNNRL